MGPSKYYAHAKVSCRVFTEADIADDIVLCVLRASCETIYTRALEEKTLRDIIRSILFPILPSVLSWSHARAIFLVLCVLSSVDMKYFDKKTLKNSVD